MRKILWIGLVLTLVALLELMAQQPTASVHLAFLQWKHDYPAWLVAVSIVVYSILLIILSSSLSTLRHRWRQWQWARRDRMSHETLTQLTQGMLAIWGQDWEQAQALFQKLIKRQECPPLLAWLGHAYASECNQDRVGMQQSCQQAFDRFPNHREAIVLAQARWLCQNGAYSLASTAMENWLSQSQSPALELLVLQAQALYHQNAHQALAECLITLGKRLPMSQDKLIHFQDTLPYWALALGHADPDTISRLWWSLPKAWQLSASCLKPYLAHLSENNDTATARKLLEKACQKALDVELMTLYAQASWIPANDRLKRLMAWHEAEPNQPKLLAHLAKAYQAQGMHAQTLSLMQRLVTLQPSVENRLALAQAMVQAGSDRQALERVVMG